ncbi:MAG: bile acid:sodium symporter [Pseudobdellovibrionaceae bacterium]|jgi:bile acid transporter
MISELERKLLGIMMIVIMFGMGSGLVWKDFFRALKKPQGLFIGAISQFGLMPLIAYTLGIALNLSPEASIGLLIMGCVPGGTTSNIFTYFSKGDLALSIMMTVFSTLLAVVLTPLLIFTYGAKILQDSQLDVPFGDVSMTLFVLLVPVAIGMFVRKMNANVGAVSEFIGGLLGIFVILFLIVTWIPRNAGLLATTPLNIYLASLGLGLCGFALGYLFARLARQNEKRAMTICLETGIQNGPLGIAIVLFSFPEEVRQGILLIPVLYSLFIVLSSAAATVFFRKWMTRLEQQKLKTELL